MEAVLSRLKIRFKARIGKQVYIIPDDLFRRYLQFTTLIPDKTDDWGFHLVIMYMNALSPELKLKSVTANYRVPNITSLNVASK